MSKASSNPVRRRQIDRRFLAEITSGPLWGYTAGPRTRQFDELGGIVEQHWDAVLADPLGTGLSLATSIRSVASGSGARPEYAALLDEANLMAALVTEQSMPTAATQLLLVDGRCLQHRDFAQRGIGRLARSILQSVVEHAPLVRTIVVTNDSLPPIAPATIPSAIAHVASSELGPNIEPFEQVGEVAVLDPAPMTHPPSPLDHLRARRIAVVHDYVPLHAPDIYLPSALDQLGYLIRLVRLRCFDRYWCNSGAIATETRDRLGCDDNAIGVLPPPSPLDRNESSRPDTIIEPFFFAPVGADRRKNLPCAVSTLAHRSARGWTGNLVILSHMPDPHRKELNELAAASGVDSNRIIVVSDLTDSEVTWLYEHAELAIIPSFDEGLSLPVLEAIDADCPVVASDIPPHRELLGPDEILCAPDKPSAFADQIDVIRQTRSHTLERQQAALSSARRRRSFDDTIGMLVSR